MCVKQKNNLLEIEISPIQFCHKKFVNSYVTQAVGKKMYWAKYNIYMSIHQPPSS